MTELENLIWVALCCIISCVCVCAYVWMCLCVCVCVRACVCCCFFFYLTFFKIDKSPQPSLTHHGCCQESSKLQRERERERAKERERERKRESILLTFGKWDKDQRLWIKKPCESWHIFGSWLRSNSSKLVDGCVPGYCWLASNPTPLLMTTNS